jgi:3,4-dihydroxy 2-butanone 4-phosphate synthase / GTP cyclohydrolase II
MPRRAQSSPFATVEEALEELRAGRLLIVVDDEAREHEGDLVAAAAEVTPEIVNTMATLGRGLVCTALTGERLAELGLPLMVPENTSLHGTAFTVSVDVRLPGRTGISAWDRAATIRALCDASTRPADLARPGHIFPLQAQAGGVLARPGHTEAGVDLARLAGLPPAAVLCEIMRPDGTMARTPDLVRLARQHGYRIVTVAAIADYRRRTERLVQAVGEANLPTSWGDFRVVAYESTVDGGEYLALVRGEVEGREEVLARVHSQCLTGDVLGSVRCDCGDQLRQAMAAMAREEAGVVVYVTEQEGRGIGLGQKIKAYALQDAGRDTVQANLDLGFPPDLRDYSLAAQVLADLGVRSVRLLTNNRAKVDTLERCGVPVVDRVPLEARPRRHNIGYLRTKRDRLGHELGGLEDLDDVDVLREAQVQLSVMEGGL